MCIAHYCMRNWYFPANDVMIIIIVVCAVGSVLIAVFAVTSFLRWVYEQFTLICSASEVVAQNNFPFYFYFRKRKFNEDIQRMLWKINIDDLNFKTEAESVRQKRLSVLQLKIRTERGCTGLVAYVVAKCCMYHDGQETETV